MTSVLLVLADQAADKALMPPPAPRGAGSGGKVGLVRVPIPGRYGIFCFHSAHAFTPTAPIRHDLKEAGVPVPVPVPDEEKLGLLASRVAVLTEQMQRAEQDLQRAKENLRSANARWTTQSVHFEINKKSLTTLTDKVAEAWATASDDPQKAAVALKELAACSKMLGRHG